MNLGKFDCATGISNTLYVKDDLSVRTATDKDKAFIDKLQKDNSYAVGFIQATVWDKYVFGGERNFVVGRKAYSYAKVQQIAVREDARRLDYGSALIAVDRMGVTLRCRVDLDSNHFWKALGFSLYGVWEKGKINHVGFKASDDINLWRIDLNDQLLTLFSTEEMDNGMWVVEQKTMYFS